MELAMPARHLTVGNLKIGIGGTPNRCGRIAGRQTGAQTISANDKQAGAWMMVVSGCGRIYAGPVAAGLVCRKPFFANIVRIARHSGISPAGRQLTSWFCAQPRLPSTDLLDSMADFATCHQKCSFLNVNPEPQAGIQRSEERRVGNEGEARWTT